MSRNNMDKTTKEEALKAVSEIDNLLSKLSGMFLSLELSLKKAIRTAENARARSYSEILLSSPSTQATLQRTPTL